ncbi:LicD family protein [Chloroflexota bacterium]
MIDPLSAEEEEMWNTVIDSVEPMDIGKATVVLKEITKIMDDAGVTFFLRQGTCLGAIRDGTIIPWDDDIDLGSIMGLHGLVEESVESLVTTFRQNGFITKVVHQDLSLQVILAKSFIRIEWLCYKVFGDSIYQYPAVKTPVKLFANLKKIQFVGEELKVPNPPEEYLRLKYGEDWKIPKQSGSYERDVMDLITKERTPGRAGRFKQLLFRYITGQHVSQLGVVDHTGNPVRGAEVVVVGVGSHRTNKLGYARLYIPETDDYALIVRFGDHEELLYMERIAPGKTYKYQMDPQKTSGRYGVLIPGKE